MLRLESPEINPEKSPEEEIDSAEVYDHPLTYLMGGGSVGFVIANVAAYLASPETYSAEVSKQASAIGGAVGAMGGSAISYASGMLKRSNLRSS